MSDSRQDVLWALFFLLLVLAGCIAGWFKVSLSISVLTITPAMLAWIAGWCIARYRNPQLDFRRTCVAPTVALMGSFAGALGGVEGYILAFIMFVMALICSLRVTVQKTHSISG
jgi:hypothetical protein